MVRSIFGKNDSKPFFLKKKYYKLKLIRNLKIITFE